MADIIYSEYLFSAENLVQSGGFSWSNLNNAIGENSSLTSASFSYADTPNFITDFFKAVFDDNSRILYFQTINGYEVGSVEYRIKYKIIWTSAASVIDVSSSFNLALNDVVVTDYFPSITNGSFYAESGSAGDSEIRTMSVVFESLISGAPSYAELTSETLKGWISFNGSVTDDASVICEIYEVQQIITLREIVPEIVYSEYLLAAENLAQGSGIIWNNLGNIIGENSSLTVFSNAYFDISENSVSDFLVASFNDEVRIPYFQAISGYQIGRIEYQIKYQGISTDYISVLDIVADYKLLLENVVQNNLVPIIVNGTIHLEDLGSVDTGIKTMKVIFDSLLNGVPSYDDLTNKTIQGWLSFSQFNLDPISPVYCDVYEIKQIITLRQVISDSVISLIDADAGVERPILIMSSQISDRGFFDPETIQTFNYIIRNDGPTDLIINSISIDTLNIIRFGIAGSFPITIESGTSLSLSLDVSVPYVGAFVNERITINNNSRNNPNFILAFTYYGIIYTSTVPLLESRYNGILLEKNKVLALSSVPLNISNIISIEVYNKGTKDLAITSYTIAGNATIAAGTTLESGLSIQPNDFRLLNLNLNSAPLGNKSATVIIISNDAVNNPFIFTFAYSVLNQSNVVLYNGSSILSNGDIVDLTSIDKGKSLTKSYILKNSGIYKTVSIDSIIVDSSLTVSSSSSFPFSLLPNAENSLVFNIMFDTENAGLKEGSFTINYNEGSVP